MQLSVVKLRWVSVQPDSRLRKPNRFANGLSDGRGLGCAILETTIVPPFYDSPRCLAFVVVASAILPHRLKGWDLGVCFPQMYPPCIAGPNGILFTDSGNDLLKSSSSFFHLLSKLTRILDIYWTDLMHPWWTLQRYQKLYLSFTKNQIIIRRKNKWRAIKGNNPLTSECAAPRLHHIPDSPPL